MVRISQIKIDRNRTGGAVDKRIFGHFVEHCGQMVYGGIVDRASGQADEDGLRSDVAAAFRGLNAPVLRWPGGNFSSGYHWEDGVGPPDKRPVRYDLEWQIEESNQFGTDEYIRFCRKIGAEPYICVNAGSGTAEEAAHWVEYCNYNGGSYYASLREKNGSREPYGVKLWGLGNELYGRGQIGRKDIGQYIDCVKEFSKLMKRVDPTIKLVAVGLEKTEWNYRLVKEAGEYIDYLAVHSYHVGDVARSYAEIAALSILTEEQIYEMKCSIDAASYYIKDRRNEPVNISVDEWNLREWSHEKFIEWLTIAYDFNTNNKELVSRHSPLARGPGLKTRTEIDEFVNSRRSEDDADSRITMADAVYTACVLNTMVRMSDRVKIGGYSPVINGKGLFSTLGDRIIYRPTYHVFALYSQYAGEKALDIHVGSETDSIYLDSLPYNTNRQVRVASLDAAATMSEKEGKLFVYVVNRKEQEKAKGSIVLDGFAVRKAICHSITSRRADDFNDLSDPDRVAISHAEAAFTGSSLEYELEPHSVNVFEIDFA